MFPLHTKSFPTDAAALRDALEQSLKRVVVAQGSMVTVEDSNYPELEAIRVSVDGARTVWRPPPPARAAGATEPALRVRRFELCGQPIMVERAAIDLACTARDVQIAQGRDATGDLVLILRDAAEGRVEVSATVAELEALLLAGAKAEAHSRGITIEDVKLQLHSRSARSLAAQVQVSARKMLLSATVQINGEIEIDDRLNARLSGLSCSANGALGSTACGFLGPQLERFNHREFSLLALPLGEIQLRDIRLAAGERLSVTASFGSAAKTL